MLGIIKSKKKKEEEEQKAKRINKAQYKVHIYEKYTNNMPRHIKSFVCDRYVDEDDNVPYLKNDTENFYEIFPNDENVVIKESKQELEKQLQKKEEQYKKESDKEIPNVNFADLRDDIKKIRKKLRTFDYSKDAGYPSLGDNNMPEFIFIREGSSFFPTKWDLETQTIIVPSDSKKKQSLFSLRNKEQKYPTGADKIKATTWVFFVASIIFVMFNLWIGWKNVDTYSENRINQIMEDQVKYVNDITKDVKGEADQLNQLTDQITGQIGSGENESSEQNEGDVKGFK